MDRVTALFVDGRDAAAATSGGAPAALGGSPMKGGSTWGTLASGVAIALVLRGVHASIFAYGGAWVIGAVVGGAAVFAWQSWRRARRLGVVPAASPAAGSYSR